MRFCSARAAAIEHDLVALALVKALLPANANHGARIRAVGAAAQRNLVHDCRAVDQPADGADVGPGECRIIEDAGVLRLARQQLIDHFIAVDPERLGGAVQVCAMTALVLHLGDQNGLAQQLGARVIQFPSGQHADDLGMGMLGDLADQGRAIARGHPILRLDLLLPIDARLEAPLARQLIRRRGGSGP